jgi:hypothetical protein
MILQGDDKLIEIKVLQEVAAARSITVICGGKELTGISFHYGVRAAISSYIKTLDPLRSIASVIALIGGAGLSHGLSEKVNDASNLGIHPLPDLIDMFRSHEATDRRDKVYALIGMSTLDLNISSLSPDYETNWYTTFDTLLQEILGPDMKVTSSAPEDDGVGIITADVQILGYVCAIQLYNDDSQFSSISIEFPYAYEQDLYRKRVVSYNLPSSNSPVAKGDLLCLIEGSKKPTIIRLQGGHLVIIAIAVDADRFIPEVPSELWCSLSTQDVFALRKAHLFWVWDSSKFGDATYLGDGRYSKSIIFEGMTGMLNLSNLARFLEHVDGLHVLCPLLEDIGRFSKSMVQAPQHVAAQFEDLRTIVQVWPIYILLRKKVEYSFHCIVKNQGARSWDFDLFPDAVFIRNLLQSYPDFAVKILDVTSEMARWTSSDTIGPDDGTQILALLLELWGMYLPPVSIVELIKAYERDYTFDMKYSYRFDRLMSVATGLTSMVFKIVARHPNWGAPHLRALFEFAKDDTKQMEQLLQDAIVKVDDCSPSWRTPLVGTVFGGEEFGLREELRSCSVWEHLALHRPFDASLEFFYGSYPSDEGRAWLQKRKSHLLRAEWDLEWLDTWIRKEKLDAKTYRRLLWDACANGHAGYVQILIAYKQAYCPEEPYWCVREVWQGRWYRIDTFQVAAFNGHVRCCELLITGGLDSWSLWRTEGATNPNARRVFEALSHLHPRTTWDEGYGPNVAAKALGLA